MSSPFLLAAVLEKQIESETRIYFVKIALHNGLYVDNSSFAHNFAEIIVQFYIEARRVLQKGNFNLRQWSTNCEQVRDLARAEGVYFRFILDTRNRYVKF